MHPAPHSRGVHVDGSLPQVNPTLRENWVPLSHPPACRVDPEMARGGGRGASLACLLAPLVAPPRRGLSQHRVLGQARLTAQDRGLMERQDGFPAAGVLRPGVVSAQARKRLMGRPFSPGLAGASHWVLFFFTKKQPLWRVGSQSAGSNPPVGLT